MMFAMSGTQDVIDNDDPYEETAALLDHTESNADCERCDSYQKTIDSCGFGAFQIILLLVSGLALASDSVEIQVVSFVLPSACDLNMTSTQKGWLNGIIFGGMMVGGYLFGSVADIKGRRYVLLWSMSINGLFGLTSAFAPTFYWFLLLRFLSGVGVGAAMPILFSYFIEFMPTVRRGPMIGLLASFWMMGNIITSLLAWLIIPHVEIGSHINDLVFGSWRIFVSICALPSLSSALIMLFMPESPLFLYKVGRYTEAKNVFIRMFRTNCGKNKPIPNEINEFPVHRTDDEDEIAKSCEVNWCSCSDDQCILIKILHSTKQLFVGPLLLPTIILLIIWFTLSFGYYGLWMWFPEIFKRMEEGTGAACSGGMKHVVSNTTLNLTCLEKVAQQTNIYFESFLVAAANIPGNIITVLCINKIGRRQLLAASMILSSISVFFFSMVTNRVQMIVMSCIFSGMSIAGWNVLDALALENYPTNLRSTAFGIQSVVGRIAAITGNVAFGEMVDLHCAIPLLLVAAFLAIGGLSALKLPKTDTSHLS